MRLADISIQYLRSFTKIFGVVVFLFATGACGQSPTTPGESKAFTNDNFAPDQEERWGVHRYKRIHWQEQVRLSTGDTIVVKRGERRRSAYGGGGSPGWVFDEAWLEAMLPAVGKSRWAGALSPLVLDVTPRGEWYLLGVVRASRGEKDYRLTERKRYVAFKLHNNAWQRVEFSEFPEILKPNLLASTDRLEIEGAKEGMLVDFEMKLNLDSRPTLSEVYKRIDRSLGE